MRLAQSERGEVRLVPAARDAVAEQEDDREAVANELRGAECESKDIDDCDIDRAGSRVLGEPRKREQKAGDQGRCIG